MKFLDCIFLKLVYLLCSFSYIELSRRQGVLYENKNQTCYFIITDGFSACSLHFPDDRGSWETEAGVSGEDVWG